MMTADETRILQESQQEIKLESQKIANSMTRILMLGGPNFVDALLENMQKANNSIKEQLNIKMEVNFDNNEEQK